MIQRGLRQSAALGRIYSKVSRAAAEPESKKRLGEAPRTGAGRSRIVDMPY